MNNGFKLNGISDGKFNITLDELVKNKEVEEIYPLVDVKGQIHNKDLFLHDGTRAIYIRSTDISSVDNLIGDLFKLKATLQ